ncbi:hypothetical protein GF382_03545 [Candidatus Falkowbacteria bacterium]|nr:hypothetical protein [Candidatus Falkowbacteria bacterium]
MKWINFFHLYQLANADSYVIEEATEESYKHIAEVLEQNPRAKITMNITGCLVLRWRQLGYNELIGRFKKLVAQGQVELVGSAAYHSLLPLIPQKEIKKQIEEDINILKDNFGKDIQLNGFFFPEMAYGKEAARIVKKYGFEWAILDEISYNGRLGQVDHDKVYLDKASGLKIVFRSRKYSSCYFPSFFKDNPDISGTIITGTDGELYGLRHKDNSKHWQKLLKRDDLETETISEFISEHKKTTSTDLVPSSWESAEEELKEGNSYYLWHHKGNEIQDKIWELADLAYKTVEKYEKDGNYNWARWHLVRGLASCTFWWASAKDFTPIFGPYAWNPDQVERGINELVRAIRSLDDVKTREAKIEAEKLYLDIKHLVWEKHWTYYWKRSEE